MNICSYHLDCPDSSVIIPTAGLLCRKVTDNSPTVGSVSLFTQPLFPGKLTRKQVQYLQALQRMVLERCDISDRT